MTGKKQLFLGAAFGHKRTSLPLIQQLLRNSSLGVFQLIKASAILCSKYGNNDWAAAFHDDPRVIAGNRWPVTCLVRYLHSKFDMPWKSRVIQLLTEDGEHLVTVFTAGDLSIVYLLKESRHFPGGGPSEPFVHVALYGRPLSTFSVGANRLTAIVPLPEMQIALSTEDPSIVILDQDGEVEYLSNPDIIQFQNVAESMRLSSDGKIVAFQQGTQSPYTVFSIEDQTLDVVARVPPTLFGIRTQHENIRVDNWKDVHILDQMPTLNGRPISLQQYDISRSLAVSNNGKYAVIGTDWGIYLIDSTATTIWEKKTSYVVWGLNISGDGKIFVAGLSDGTIRWYRMDDSIEIMAAYFHPNGEDWIAWTPEGYYTSSPNGDQFIGWHINRGIDETPDFYRAVQFERVLFRPDIVHSHFASEGRQPVRRPDLTSIAPPRIELTRLNARSKGGINRAQAVFQIDVEKNSQPMHDFGIYINNIPVTAASERQLASADRSRFTREIVVDLNEPDNLIRVEVFNGKSMGLLERYVEGPSRKLEPPKGDLYLFAVGANQFDNVVRCADPDRRDWRWNSLDFASADAVAVKNLFLDLEGETFNKVHWRLLSDDEGPAPTKANIEKEIDFVKKAGPNDTVMIFLASHGISNSRGNYYFVPRDGSVEDGCRLYDDRDDIETLVSWEVFFDALRVTAGRRLMVVDTCHSGDMQIGDKFDAFSLTKRSTASSYALMSAATGLQESQEYYKGGQGLFTYAVLDALRRGVDYDGDGWTTLREVFDYSKPFVEQYRDKFIPQTPVLVDPEPLGETRLGRAPRNDMAAIPNDAQPSGATL